MLVIYSNYDYMYQEETLSNVIVFCSLSFFFDPKYFKSNLLLLKVIGPIPEPDFTGFEYPILFSLSQGQS